MIASVSLQHLHRPTVRVTHRSPGHAYYFSVVYPTLYNYIQLHHADEHLVLNLVVMTNVLNLVASALHALDLHVFFSMVFSFCSATMPCNSRCTWPSKYLDVFFYMAHRLTPSAPAPPARLKAHIYTGSHRCVAS